LSSDQNTQEFYRRSLKGFDALHGLIYRTLRNIGTLKMVFLFLPLICWRCCYALKRTSGFSTLRDGGGVGGWEGVRGEGSQVREKQIPLLIRLLIGLGLATIFPL
jgi:hypothetical protein